MREPHSRLDAYENAVNSHDMNKRVPILDQKFVTTGTKRALLVALTTSMIGCSGAQVEVPAEFPVPLTTKLPVTMGLVLDETLTSYQHIEELESGGDWSIDLGSAQVPMFINLAEGMFQTYRVIEDREPPFTGVSAVLHPKIGDLQFTTPQQTRSGYFEVWIRYEFELFDKQGTSLGNWDMTAYGKAHEQNSGTSAALQRAALNACRDAMAFFTLRFESTPVVKTWLDGRRRGAT
ncbi:MAG: hypothetical protein QF921_17610 [Pseudomonadales bacterium]|jgi:hypothetical protein|nr:hypothetical protein [Pseudomonadales bacterium]MDP6472870.1 hypothetical protein [Pseudomonadales bacterium]MDP6826374.1 hypothetical protein [Pseudomonadales bacterium]MDP6973304.1 hypothetical protein [Pseudomonadales bacterium]|tara:strand:+ start:1013 stop:1717 length:705 start_codon:yes stop_codon:yes gene_type:complete